MDTLPPPLPPEYKDRRTGLIVFGVMMILLGAFVGLSVPATLVGLLLGPHGPAQALSTAQALTSMAHMTVFAVALIWLGIGSIKARRWARALALCGGWIGIVVGVLTCLALPWMLPSIRAAMESQPGMEKLPPAFATIMMVVTAVFIGVFYVGIPIAVILFYRSRHVKRTCEVRDPVERWTDRCPLPVLAVVLVLGYTVVALLAALIQFGHAFPLFGAFVTGVPSYILWFLVIGTMVWATIGFYRLDPRVWWGYLALMMLFTVNTAVTFSRGGLLDFYRAAGMPDAQLALMEHMPMVRGNGFLWMMIPGTVLLIGYLIFLRRYFARSPAANE